VGDIDTVHWSATDNIGVDSVVIEFSSDNGTSWDFVANPQPQDTVYEWVIPDVHSTECLMRVSAFDAGDNMGVDVSDSCFTIIDNVAPEVTVIVPNGGEVWYWNYVETIEWNSSDNVGIDSLDISLSLDGGVTYPISIAHIVGNDSSYDWMVPETVSYECKIRVTAFDVGLNTIFDESDSVFTIGELGVEEQVGIPKHFAVMMASSNPFTGNLCVKLQLPEARVVKVAVYDVEGRLIGHIADDRFTPGYYTLTLNKGLAAGIYFVYVKAGDFEKTEKIIQLK
jgi:hypothetical protein